MLVNVTCLPVGGMRRKSLVCVPRQVWRTATLSPSATRSSIVAFRSGKAVKKADVNSLNASIPWIGACPGKCATKLSAKTSSLTRKFFGFTPCSYSRRTKALFSSVDMRRSPLFISELGKPYSARDQRDCKVFQSDGDEAK